MKPKILIIVGPTAVGKSALAVLLAQKFNGEIISADSRQVYTGLDIGTGKITKAEMCNVPHYLLDVATPKEIFSVSEYKKLGQNAIESILDKKKLPIVVGGTGFYIDALLGMTSLPEVPPNPTFRTELEKKTTEELFQLLLKSDPGRANSIDKHNKVRLIRALEIVESLGKVPLCQPARSTHHTYIWIGLEVPLEKLVVKIKNRLLIRLDNGMLEEARNLHVHGLSYERMDSLGLEYRYMGKYLQNKITYEEMVENIYRESRNYSKRQMTWFKTNKNTKWFDVLDIQGIEKYISGKLI